MSTQNETADSKRANHSTIPAASSENENASSGGNAIAPLLFQMKASDARNTPNQNDNSSLGGRLMPPPFQLKAGSGNMPDEVRGKMEGAFQSDFSDVNVHQNSKSATDVGALAYAQGNDVHFAPGQFKPNSTAGQELIGHELTHVVQQREGRVQPTTQTKGMPVNDDKSLENEADMMGKKAASGEVVNNKATQMKKGETNSAIQQKTIQRKLVVTGEKANKARVLAILNKNLFNYTVNIDDKTGEITIKANDLVGPPSPAQQAMYEHLNRIISDEKTTTVGVTSEDKNTIGGNYSTGNIDIADIEALAGNEGTSDHGALLHEIIEQYHKQVHGEDYNEAGKGEHSGAHGKGMDGEKDLNGLSRGATTALSQKINPDGTFDAIFETLYTKPDGTGVITTVVIKSNNIISSSERDIK